MEKKIEKENNIDIKKIKLRKMKKMGDVVGEI